MEYCPANRSLSDIWIEGGFSPCFLLTVTGSFLAGLMLIFGIAELRMYCRFGSPVDAALKYHSKLYWMQIVSGLILIVLPVVQLSLKGSGVTGPLYGFHILFCLSQLFIWIGSMALVQVERNFDLPTPPPRGHSIFLVVFWGFAFVVDNLMLVNFNGKHWYFVVHSSRDQISLGLFCVEYVMTLMQFILGIRAPGLPSFEQRCDFAYDKMPPVRYYGSTGVTEIVVVPADADRVDSMGRLRAELKSGELLRQFNRLPRAHHSDIPMGEAAHHQESMDEPVEDSNRRRSILSVIASGSDSSHAGTSQIGSTRIEVPLANGIAPVVYIACQTPTAHTTESFWKLMWETRSTVIVSMQKDFHKSHRYFPSLDECVEVDQLLISNIREAKPTNWFFSTKSFVIREFSVIHLDNQNELLVQQFQFNHWSDDLTSKKKITEFADFVLEVRAEIPLRPGPIVIHGYKDCGLTGVYILVDMALLLIETNEDVMPIELLKTLRTQRPGMVPTKDQMKFACENILALSRMIQKGGHSHNSQE